jgi:hypothetical protein
VARLTQALGGRKSWPVRARHRKTTNCLGKNRLNHQRLLRPKMPQRWRRLHPSTMLRTGSFVGRAGARPFATNSTLQVERPSFSVSPITTSLDLVSC